MSYRSDYDPQREESEDYSSHREGRRHAHHTTGPRHEPPTVSNPDYKTIPTHGESTSYYNPANTFPDEPPQKPTTSYQPQEESDSLPHPLPAALNHASLQNPSTPSTLFTTALHHLAQVQKTGTHSGSSPLDEASFIQAHQAVYNVNNSSENQQQTPHTTPCIGMAAAMNALKTFTSGGETEGNSQAAFIGHAMAQAGKLFDEQHSAGNVVSGYNYSRPLFGKGKC
jgi:hypothetical protein